MGLGDEKGLLVKVLYFASARESAQSSTEDVAVAEGAMVEDLARELARLHPSLEPVLTSVRYSVNHEIVDGSAVLREEDEVGVIPPVAGG